MSGKDEKRRKELDARLARAVRAAFSGAGPAMPADLKAALKREARERDAARRPSRLGGILAALAAHRAAYGLSAAAFAAAAVALAVRLSATRATPGAPPTASVPRSGAAAAQAWTDPEAAKGLAGLWGDDSGRDGDEG